jgi:hypothetical protein
MATRTKTSTTTAPVTEPGDQPTASDTTAAEDAKNVDTEEKRAAQMPKEIRVVDQGGTRELISNRARRRMEAGKDGGSAAGDAGGGAGGATGGGGGAVDASATGTTPAGVTG